MGDWENPADEARRLLVAQLRRTTGHVDGRSLPWLPEFGPEPSWFTGQAILADPVLSARYGLNEEKTP